MNTFGPRTQISPGSPATTSSPSSPTRRTSIPGSGGPIEPQRGASVDRGRAHDRRGLGEPVALVDRDAEAVAERLGALDRAARPRPTPRAARSANVTGDASVVRAARGSAANIVGTPATIVTRVRADELGGARPRRSGRAAPSVMPACSPTPSADVQAEDVEERQRARGRRRPAPTCSPGCALDLADVRGEVPVREHRGARRARGARREEQHRELVVVALDLGRHRLAGVEVALRRTAPGSSSSSSVPGPHTSSRAPTRCAWPASTAGGRERVERDRDGTGPERAEVGGHEGDVVVAGDRHPIAGPDRPGGQARRPVGRPAPRARRTRRTGPPRPAPPSRGASCAARSSWDTRFTGRILAVPGPLRGGTHPA